MKECPVFKKWKALQEERKALSKKRKALIKELEERKCTFCKGSVTKHSKTGWCKSCSDKQGKLTKEEKQRRSEKMKGNTYTLGMKWSKKHREKMKTVQPRGKKHKNWKEKCESISAPLKWIRNTYGVPTECEEDECWETSQTFEWSNISGRYKKTRSDYRQLCASCRVRSAQGYLNKAELELEVYTTRK